MVQVKKQQNGGVLSVYLIGAIEETVDFTKLIGPPPNELEVHCREVSRINSAGIRAWIIYFQSCQAKGTKLRFLECSMPIVDQLNQISNFSCGGTVESIYAPFFCHKCKVQLMALFKVSELQKVNFNLPTLPCSKCGATATFDDQIEEYFSCFRRN